VVTVEADRAAVRLGVDPQVVDRLRLEQVPGELDLWPAQALRGGSQRRNREGRIGQVALRVAARRTRERSFGFQLAWSSIRKRRRRVCR